MQNNRDEYESRPEIKQHKKEYAKQYHKDHEEEHNNKSAEYYATHKDQWDEYRKRWEATIPKQTLLFMNRVKGKRSEQKLKLETFQQYSPDLNCQNCKRKLDIRFLTIQHIKGRKHHNHDRKMTGARMYRWLRDNNYPKKDFEVWCFNCNSSEGKRHTDEPETFISKHQKHYFKTYLPRVLIAKEKCLDYYGRQCACCGVKNHDWLSIEHSGGKKGALHPKGQAGLRLFLWLFLHKFPKGYDIFCYNCNSAKGNLGVCPHQE